MTREELCIHACKYAIGELTRKGSFAFITSAHDGRQQISWVEVVEWLKELKGYRSIKDQIAFAKRNIRSENSDYLTGYISALSTVEGMIAEVENAESEDKE